MNLNTLSERVTPIYILSGFLGSGKTTLLQRMVTYWQEQGLRPAVIMNEIGDVNLEGALIEETVPMTEMLSGCICCTIRGDLSLEISNLIQKESPDVIVIEATGIANPMEILDGVTEAALYMRIDLKSVITVVDARHLLELYEHQQGKTYRLMQEQIRCASYLILNKVDRVSEEEQAKVKEILSRWNEYAPIIPSVRCDVDWVPLFGSDVHHLEHIMNREHEHEESHDHAHHSHDHVMVYTHYFKGPIDSQRFEELVNQLPREVYRAKGVMTFSDTTSRFLFQYAFREADFLKINPQGVVPDVVVFIGEHFSQAALKNALDELEKIG
ncbi:CobW family GTP-binding protein [Paenibacillus crassostreae]|uniref:Cobalamin biosynthesis protein n=1 Tax=Paenibacillus crassostreae TaxID=1763538 RepID=A0A167FKG7_9BACL|nr:CobW family GTP-binding protein [Paenibacillus crassostreae]AOZ94309.1 cobalamin biosynthesis protein CobW [Paenibacillus crassostreae]OAB76653.1 cobalamin biosynthesis protein [Paenibacillus crassostreae]